MTNMTWGLRENILLMLEASDSAKMEGMDRPVEWKAGFFMCVMVLVRFCEFRPEYGAVSGKM